MVILASKSPRRIELLKLIYHDDFKIIPSDIDETVIKSDNIEDLPLKIAYAKGKNISLLYPDDLVISADTIVVFNNQKYGKPKSEADVYDFLSKFNEKEHDVITGYHFFLNGEAIKSNSVKSTVMLHELNKEKIAAYIKTKLPFDKAGAYGIQDHDYIKSTIIKGSMSNIMGFPLDEIEMDLSSLPKY